MNTMVVEELSRLDAHALSVSAKLGYVQSKRASTCHGDRLACIVEKVTRENQSDLNRQYYGKLRAGDWVVKRFLDNGQIRLSGPFSSCEVAMEYSKTVYGVKYGNA